MAKKEKTSRKSGSFFTALPIRRKILSIPMLAVVSLLIVGGFFYHSHDTTFGSLSKVNAADDVVNMLRDTETRLIESKSALLQGLSWKMGYVENAKVRDKLDESKKHAASVGEALAGNKAAIEGLGVTQEKYDVLVSLQDDYAKSLEGASKMVLVDGNAAILMLNDAFGKFDNLFAALENITASSQKVKSATVDNLKSVLSTSLYSVIGVAAVFIVLLMIIGTAVGNVIANPIQKLTRVMTALADGKLDVRVEDTDREDEVGNMARGVEFFKQGLITSQALQDEQKDQQKADLNRASRLSTIVLEFEGTITEVVRVFTESSRKMQDAAESLGYSVETSESTATRVSSASTQAMANVQTVATAVQEMAASIQEISSQITKSQQIVGSAVELTRSASQQTDTLSESAEKIGEIIGLIQDIAAQTNLLALNATIEAARAGNAGKGFAVVASEVKALASQTASATEQISQNISNVQNISRGVTQAIESIRKSIDEVNAYSASVSAAVEEQSHVTSEIAENMQSAAVSVSEISNNMNEVISAVNVVKTIADQVRGTSGALSDQTMGLNDSVTTFCANINK